MSPVDVAKSVTVTSAAGVLALLDEPSAQLRTFALNQLNDIVDEFWAEISGSIGKIEELYEDQAYESRKLAALVASKVYYHLGEYDDALSFALGAGDAFDVAQRTQYVNTVISKCIDEYVKLSVEEASIDERLADIVERMFQNTYDEGEYKQAVGIALEARSLARVEEAISRSGDVSGMLNYVYSVLESILLNRRFRLQVLQLLVRLYTEAGEAAGGVDYLAICQCLLLLDDAKAVSDILVKLVKGSEDDTLMAYQVAFDLSDNETQHFLSKVAAALPEQQKKAPGAPVKAEPAAEGEEAAKMDVEPDPVDAAFEAEQSGEAKELADRLKKMKAILSGETTVHLALEFLYSNNKTDMLLLKQIKDSVEPRNSITHNAAVMCNALMHAGTTVDTFLRENIEWLKKSTNWAKFAATGCVGVIHKGHIAKGRAVLNDYLPGSGRSGGSPYLEGGALYALGIINANHGESVRAYLLEQLTGAGGPNSEVLQHGACLGLGLASMGSADDAIFEQLKAVMYGVNAVSGEAAGYGMGLVMLGTATDKVEELVNFAKECQHEKITRGVAMGLALIMYGREEEADVLIEQLCMEKEAILRYGAMYTVGMAYAGTANNPAVRRLLHVAVSDVSDDVRRAAVMNLGFVLSNVPERVPRLVSLLASSYNPHVRYGAVMAVAFACAGTGLKVALELLQPMTKDAVDFVRQGAYIALAMVLIQRSEAQEPAVKELKTSLEKVINDKHEDTMTKFGCIIAEGILNAGGRNVTIALHAPSGHKRMAAIVGMAVFSQYWYWYPLIPMLSLSFSPTAVIGLNKELNMPVTSFKSDAKPTLFAYPPMKEEKKKDLGPAAPTAVLSITEKAKKRDLKRTKSQGGMDVEEEGKKEGEEKKEEAPMEVEKKEGEGEEEAKPQNVTQGSIEELRDALKTAKTEGAPAEELTKLEEKIAELEGATHLILQNPARVTIPQRAFIVFDQDERYRPVRSGPMKGSGVIMLCDSRPEEEQVIVETSMPGIEGDEPEEDEPEPPEPFEYAEYM